MEIDIFNDYMTVQEYAEKVGTYPQKVQYFINNKALPAIKHSGRWWLPKDSTQSWPPVLKPKGRPTKKENV